MACIEIYFVRHGESENNILHTKLREAIPVAAEAEVAFHQQRHYDPPLTAAGREQAALVAKRIRREIPHTDEIWVSFLSRALDTALAMHQELPEATVRVMHDITEVGGSYHYSQELQKFVAHPGSTVRDVRLKYPLFTFYSPSRDGSECGDSSTTTPTSDGSDEKSDLIEAFLAYDHVKDESKGWYHFGQGKEQHATAVKRAETLLRRLEDRARHMSRPGGGRPPLTLAIVTHGDFFKIVMTVLKHRVQDVDGFHAALERAHQTKAGAAASGRGSDDSLVKAPTDTWIMNTSVTHLSLSVSGDVPAAVHWSANYIGDASHLMEKSAL